MIEKKEEYKGKKVLLVDDDIDLLAQIKSWMEDAGFEVTTSETQAEAEKIIAEKDFDLALIDLMLEYKDSGFILCHRLKKKKSDLPVIIITGVTNATGIHFEMTDPGSHTWMNADAVLDKEIRHEQLNREIHRLMKG